MIRQSGVACCVVALGLLAPVAAGAQEPFSIQPLPRSLAELRQQFSPEQVTILEKLNRRDAEHLVRVEPPVPGLVVPASWDSADLAYSPFPAEWAAVADQPKYLVVHQPSQAFAAYEYGVLARWGPVSSGRKDTPTPAGPFNLTWRSRKRTSTDNDSWILEWYFNFINARGISFHQFDLPGYAASHACVRLLKRDAQWLYGWGVQWTLSKDGRTVEMPGTPVLIIGAFGHGETPPWTSLPSLSQTIELPSSSPHALGAR